VVVAASDRADLGGWSWGRFGLNHDALGRKKAISETAVG
jgi:hypothetical protein